MKSLLLQKALSTLEKWLWPINICLSGLLLAALWQRKLLGRYRGLTAMLAIDFVRSIILLFLPFGRNAYGVFFVVTEPLTWISYAWVAFEAYQMVLESYQGLSILGRRSLAAALCISAAIAVLTSAPNIKFDGEVYPLLLLTAVISQSVVISVLLFLLILSAFMLWYPIPLRRNIVYYTFGFSILFLALGVSMFLRSAGGPLMARISSQVYLAVELGCQVFWLFALRPAGETASVAVGSVLHAGEQSRLLAQLDSLNAILLQTSKSKAEFQ